jgi:hypothetical protein
LYRFDPAVANLRGGGIFFRHSPDVRSLRDYTLDGRDNDGQLYRKTLETSIACLQAFGFAH